MKAILMTQTGTPDTLTYQDVLEPVLTFPTQIKVRLRAAGVNPVDTKIRRNGLLFSSPLPAILGCDGAGEVVEIGSAVQTFRIGDRVWFCHGGLGGEPGNYADYTVLDARWAVLIPDCLTFEEAAAGPLVLITAWGMLYDRGQLQSSDTVLIHGGAGGVGHVAIQLAKLCGARVLTTVGSSEHADLVQQWGADEVIRYDSEDFVEKTNMLTEGKGADLVTEMVGPDTFVRSIECTAHFGNLVTLLDPGAVSFKEARLRNLRIGFELMLTPMLRNLEKGRLHHVHILKRCAEWIDQNQLAIYVSQVSPLEKAAEAHRQCEKGHTTGKIVLKMD